MLEIVKMVQSALLRAGWSKELVWRDLFCNDTNAQFKNYVTKAEEVLWEEEGMIN